MIEVSCICVDCVKEEWNRSSMIASLDVMSDALSLSRNIASTDRTRQHLIAYNLCRFCILARSNRHRTYGWWGVGHWKPFLHITIVEMRYTQQMETTAESDCIWVTLRFIACTIDIVQALIAAICVQCAHRIEQCVNQTVWREFCDVRFCNELPSRTLYYKDLQGSAIHTAENNRGCCKKRRNQCYPINLFEKEWV